ncbi:MAG: ATP-dependent zinc metalloprotease FtsH, partial [Patescibacteria group bacterium]
NFVFIVLILIIISGIFSLFSSSAENEKIIAISQLVQDINQNKIKSITVTGDNIAITYNDDSTAKSAKETGTDLGQTLINYGIDKEALDQISIDIKQTSGTWTWLGPVLFTVLPLLLFVAFFFMIFKQAKGGASQAFDFTKAKARLFGAEGQSKEKITFKDVAGLKEAKQELEEIVDFLKNPKKYLEIGARIPRGVLLVGPPGTGKTLLAKAIANEAGVPFFSISGSEFIELFVGVGASRVRDLFLQAKKAGGAIIFIDEIDSIGRTRGVGVTGGHEEREQTLNQILAEMDGFEREDGRVVIAATNRPDVLDPALLRPGRFDRRIILDLPDVNDREEILKIHCRGKPLAENVNIREIAERTPGFSGADLANLANEAAILAARSGKHQIFQEELLESIEKVLLGPERKSHALSKKEKEIVAFHEAGHALVSSFSPMAEPVRKISIVARGMAAGYTLKMPAEEKKLKTKAEFLSEIATLLGGYCAELIKFKDVTSGAANDLERASYLARKLVKEYGMSRFGPIVFGEKEGSIFLGQEFGEYKNYSEEIAGQIDKEVAKFIDNAKTAAQKIINKKRALLEKVAKTLVEKETIEKEEFEKLISGKKSAIIRAKREISEEFSTEKSESIKIPEKKKGPPVGKG